MNVNVVWDHFVFIKSAHSTKKTHYHLIFVVGNYFTKINKYIAYKALIYQCRMCRPLADAGVFSGAVAGDARTSAETTRDPNQTTRGHLVGRAGMDREGKGRPAERRSADSLQHYLKH